MSEVIVWEGLTLELEDMPALRCESRAHGDPEWAHFHDDRPATHYAQARHTCTGWNKTEGEVYPVCATRAARIMRLEALGRGVHCTSCGKTFDDPTDWIIIVGPIRERGRK